MHGHHDQHQEHLSCPGPRNRAERDLGIIVLPEHSLGEKNEENARKRPAQGLQSAMR